MELFPILIFPSVSTAGETGGGGTVSVSVMMFYTNSSKKGAVLELCLYKRFALTVMKQMTKSIKRELCGCHKDDVNPGFTMVMKLFRIVIKTSTIFFKIKAPLTTIHASYGKFSTNIFKINV